FVAPRCPPSAPVAARPRRFAARRTGDGRAEPQSYTSALQISSERPAAAHKAKRRIWIGAVVAVAIAAVAAAVLPKVLRGGDKGKKEPVAPEFIAASVALNVDARLPLTLEFSGPLVAPRTAVVRAKAAGTL